MTSSWDPEIVPKEQPLDLEGWVRALVRLAGLAIIIYGLMIVLLAVRLCELPFGRRKVSPLIVQAACKGSLRVLGFRVEVHGRAMSHPGAMVSNHCSWLDVFSLNAAARVFFVSKAEVRSWPAIGAIARAAGTVFIERRSSQAHKHKSQFERRLQAGDRLLFFPEGTSTDCRHMLAFKSTLFAAFFSPDIVETMWIQPTTLVYRAPKGEDARFYGWWGEMEFAPHFLSTLGAKRSGGVTVIFHPPVRVADFADRKALAQHCERTVRASLEAEIGAS
ncbi:MAG: lysophospholipid acyltransferase family protein [Paracoccaceae bacterium]